MTILTIRDCISQLPPSARDDQLIVVMHTKATAPDRHRSRVDTARAALERTFPGAARERLAMICALEVGGVGGPRGFAGEATARMGWASNLGKGRRQATDGSAWDAAIRELYLSYSYTPTPDDVTMAAADLDDHDTEWALAYCLRRVSELRMEPDGSAVSWAMAARTIAETCEPDGRAGRLAHRYELNTLCQLHSGRALLRAETVSEMVAPIGEPGLPESDLEPRTYIVEGVAIQLIERCSIPVYDGEDNAWVIEISTRDHYPSAAPIRRGWAWVEGEVERQNMIALHEQFLSKAGRGDGASLQAALDADRKQWEAEEAAAESVLPPT